MSRNRMVMTEPGSPAIDAGTAIGRYRIRSFIASGGMGEVYAAIDESLGREVALKLLPAGSQSDAVRIERFLREAQASSALNHPAIVSVYDAGVAGGHCFIAMELIDGQPLSKWLRGRRDLPRGIELMAQVADGLARAHAAGIVHRDLKPDNIMVARGGYAKILDFGIAKLIERADGERSGSDTAPDALLGTAAYMSPEQIDGRTVDNRSDVFSLGAVLFEVATSRKAFEGATPVDTMHNVLHQQPSFDGIADGIGRVVRRCLAKDPEERYHSMRDIALDLREYARSSEKPHVVKRRSWPLVSTAAILAAAFLWLKPGAGFAPAADPSTQPQTMMLRVTNSGKVGSATMSPDGRYVVYAAGEGQMQSIWVKQIATGTTVRILGPEASMFFSVQVSHDGNYVYYVRATVAEPNVGDIYQLPILGGQPHRIAADTEYQFTLSPDGTRTVFRRYNAFDREHRLTIAPIDGGPESILLRRKFPDFLATPMWSPSGDSIAFVSGVNAPKPSGGLFEISLKSRRIDRIKTPDWAGIGSIAWLPDGSGFLIAAYDREQPPQVWFVPRRDGATRKITSDISAFSSIQIAADGRSFTAVRDEPDANIAIARLDRPSDVKAVTSGIGNGFGYGGVRWLGDDKLLFTAFINGRPTLLSVDASGGEPARAGSSVNSWDPVISPDGQRIAFASDKSGPMEIWTSGVAGDSLSQLTHTGRAERAEFAPDGRSVIYLTSGVSQFAWRIPVSGGPPQQLTHVPTSRAHLSPDGQSLLCRLRSRGGSGSLWRTAVMAIGSNDSPRYFDVPRFAVSPEFHWMPDGRAFAFIDKKDGIANLWLQNLSGGEPRQITAFEAGEIFSYDVSRDGKRIALARGNPMRDVVLIRNFQ
ncbi:MAG: serine/threonine-protein kinase [Thermoanaerobaculia bacterium]|nr:serine/threonine-protein kinase [Thermoanaerobaculia bacterium]